MHAQHSQRCGLSFYYWSIMSRSAMERELRGAVAPPSGPYPPPAAPIAPYIAHPITHPVVVPGYYPPVMASVPTVYPTYPAAPLAAAPLPLVAADAPSELEESGGSRSKVFPVHGSQTTFNINNMLYNNILESDYFRALYQLRTYHETIGENHFPAHLPPSPPPPLG